MNKDEKRGYSKGYAAKQKTNLETIKGLKNSSLEKLRRIRELENQVQVQIYAAALQGILSSPKTWKVGDNIVNSPIEYAELATKITDQAMQELKG